MRDLTTGFIAAIIVLLGVSAYGESTATSAGQPSSGDPSQVFDPSRGVLLQGAQGQEVAEMCGASPKSRSWEATTSEIESVEQQLAPLLAADLRNTGSKELPRQYYRQYATGRLRKFHAIFINGFHEDHLLVSPGQIELAAQRCWRPRWRRRVAWCAIYIKELKKFVNYKGKPFGGTYVFFHGVA